MISVDRGFNRSIVLALVVIYLPCDPRDVSKGTTESLSDWATELSIFSASAIRSWVVAYLHARSVTPARATSGRVPVPTAVAGQEHMEARAYMAL